MHRAPRSISMTLNLAPMVDVMMCLIIFFILASKIVSAQHRGPQLAYAQAAQEIDRSKLGSRVVVNIRPTDDGLRAEYVVNTWDGQNIVERVMASDEIPSFLQRRQIQAFDSGEQEELRCVIRADRDCAYGDVEVVLRACGLAKISKIVFSANTGEDPEPIP